MTLGADRKKLYFLGALTLIGGYFFYSNVLSGPSSPEPSRPSPAAARARPAPAIVPPVAAPSSEAQAAPRRTATSSRSSEALPPSLKQNRPEDRGHPMTSASALGPDLLAKVQPVNMEGGRRNLFQVGAPPLPPEPTVTMKQDAQVAQMGPQLPPG